MSKRPKIADRKIADRRKASMSADTGGETPREASPTSAPAPAPAPAPAEAAPSKPKGAERPSQAKPTAKSSSASDTTRQGIYMTGEEFENAKAGYLADWQNGGQADTFAKWIGTVLDEHAARSTSERARLARPAGRSETRTGASRSFNITTDTIDRMRTAITEDQAADRWPSDSAWCGDAIAAAVDRARERAGGALPTPPARLPNRLRR